MGSKSQEFCIPFELLVNFVVHVVNGSSVEADDSCETIRVVYRSDCGDLRTEAVASDGGHSDVVVIHEAHYVSTHFVKVERRMVVRVAEVAVVQKPHVADLPYLYTAKFARLPHTGLFSLLKNVSKLVAGSSRSGNHSSVGMSLSRAGSSFPRSRTLSVLLWYVASAEKQTQVDSEHL